MKNFLLAFLGIIFSTFSFGQGQLLITELADPNDNDDCRYVEIYNPTSTTIDLSDDGYKLQRWTNGNSTPQAAVALMGSIAPGGFFIVCKSNSDFNTCYSPVACNQDIGPFGPADSNGDDQIAIIDCNGDIVDIFGVPGEDGSGTWHEFEDGRAERLASQCNSQVTANQTDWDVCSDAPSASCGPINIGDPELTPGTWVGASTCTGQAYFSCVLALPVTLTSFEAKPNEQKSINLAWQTASEENNDYFSIEHSTDGTTFREIATQAGNGTTDKVQNYSYLHQEVENGLHYYRLKQVDFDGKFEYTNIVTAKISHSNDDIFLTPNPTSNVILVQTKALYQRDADFQILNMQGQVVLSSVLQKGDTNMELNISDFPVGIYYLQLFVDNDVMMKKIIKQ